MEGAAVERGREGKDGTGREEVGHDISSSHFVFCPLV
jgi:hypothetical protein